MPASKPLRALMASWRQLCPLSGEAARDLRLRYCAHVLGRAVNSTTDLSDAELGRIAAVMRRELEQRPGSAGTPARGTSSSRPSNLRRFPNRNTATKEQIWKIRQLESHLGWSSEPTRLAGFLRQFFKKDRPEHLTHGQAWRAIESLFAVAARTEIKHRLGQSHQVSKSELAAEVAALKQRLSTWQPRAEAARTESEVPF